MTNHSAHKLLTSKQLGELYEGFPERFWNRLRTTGGGPDFIKINRAVRYRLSAVETWLDQHTRSNTSSATE